MKYAVPGLMVLSTFLGSSVWGMSCNELVGGSDGTQSSAASTISSAERTILDEQESFRDSIRSLSHGTLPPAYFQPTPVNRIVEMYVTYGEKGITHHEGRIVGARAGADGKAELIFSERDPNGDYSSEIKFFPIANVEAKSASIIKVITIEDQQRTAAQFLTAIQKGQHVSYVSQFGGVREEVGRIRSLEQGRSGRITSFIRVDDNGTEIKESLASVDPASIRIFKVQPRTLNATESDLVRKLYTSVSEGKYVSFRVKNGSHAFIFEGWVTQMNFASNGEYLIGVNRDNCESHCVATKYKLSDIFPESFDDRPTLAVRQTGVGQNQGRAAAQLDAYLQGKWTVGHEYISQGLYSELSVFAETNQASGASLPRDLEKTVRPGTELRLYFSGGERRVRLTVRRNRDRTWTFGDTAFDRRTISESYFDSNSKSRYTINEKERLEDSRFSDRLPAARLRDHMRSIRDVLMREQVANEFQDVLKEWSKSIPENIYSAEVIELLLHEQGQRFVLNRGFVRTELPALTESQAKQLAAINYLISNKLTFWSYNAGASGIKMGIYPRDSVNPSTLWLAGVDFSRGLLDSMKAAGLKYENGKWVPN